MADVRGVVLDVDGTLVRGETAIPGAAEAVSRLRATCEVALVSNNPIKPPAAYAERLGRHDIPVDPERVLTSGTVTADHLAAEHPEDTHFVVGAPGFLELLDDRGLDTTDDPEAADVVVGSYDAEFDYDRLAESLWALDDESARFVGTDPDVTIPTDDKPLPGSGAIIGAMANVAERDPDLVAGKPAAPAREAVLETLGLPPEDVLVVGDRLNTDIALGAEGGMRTALVLTGVATREEVEDSEVRPDHVVESIRDVPALVDGVSPR